METSTIVAALLCVLALGVGAAVGFVIGSRRGAERSRRENEVAVQRARLDAEFASREVREELAGALSRAEGLEMQVAQLEQSQRERLANDDKQHALLRSIAPMQESIIKLEKTLAELEGQRAKQHGEISEQLRVAAQSEEKLRGTADALAAALRSGNVRGQWGEVQLRRVVEAAGMLTNVDFQEQAHIRTETGAARPDVVVNIPGGKYIAVDAKVPIDKYLQAVQAQQENRAEDARTLLSEHAKTLRRHVDALAKRDYPEALGSSPQLVVAFVPSEALLSAALDADHGLLEHAFRQGVALASPTTLLSVLKTVSYSWQQQTLTTEAQRLFELSRELHKRIGTAAGHIEKMGANLRRSVDAYNSMIGSFERNVFPSARKIAELNGEDLLTEPEPLESAVRPLTAAEFTAAEPIAAEPTAADPHSQR